jgi:hypothetical protein
MRRTKEICRLVGAGLTGRAIARSLGVSNSTVGDAITRLKAAELTWESGEALSSPNSSVGSTASGGTPRPTRAFPTGEPYARSSVSCGRMARRRPSRE